MKWLKGIKAAYIALIVSFAALAPAAAQDAGTATADLLSNAYTGKVYSP